LGKGKLMPERELCALGGWGRLLFSPRKKNYLDEKDRITTWKRVTEGNGKRGAVSKGGEDNPSPFPGGEGSRRKGRSLSIER